MTSAFVRLWVNSFRMRSTSSWCFQRFSGVLKRSSPISSARPMAFSSRSQCRLPAREGDAAEVDHGVLHGHLDVLTPPGALALVQGGQDADGAVKAGAGVADR